MKAGFAFAFLLFAAACASSSSPCTSGFDVDDLDDSGISQSLKDEIFDSGNIIGKKHPEYPSGKVVVIRAASPDWESNPAVTRDYVDGVFFDVDSTPKTMRAYFRYNSWAQLLITEGATPGWITVPKKLTNYNARAAVAAAEQGVHSAQAGLRSAAEDLSRTMIVSPLDGKVVQLNGIEDNTEYMRDVLKLADVNWSALDANHNSKIADAAAQIVVLIPNAMPSSGFASVRSVSIRSVKTPDGPFDFGERRIVYFSVKATADPNSASEPIRSRQALAHAFFNLPDRYGDESGTASYDIMATTYTWTMFTMPDRIKIGWIKPKILDAHDGRCLQFGASELHSDALIVVPPKELRKATGVLEYWDVEYRNKLDANGYDGELPENGLAVWYVATGTYASGWDDVRLVQFNKCDRDPDRYKNPAADALFKRDDANPRRPLLDRTKQ